MKTNTQDPDQIRLQAGLKMPEPLRLDQAELCVELELATLAGGKTAKAARKLLKVLQPHLLQEEEDLLQILGLLAPLAQGELTPDMQSIPARTERLKARAFNIAREHATIRQASDNLLHAADAEGKRELAAFIQRLKLRTWMDEVVFYPAALLLGEYVKLTAGSQPGR